MSKTIYIKFFGQLAEVTGTIGHKIEDVADTDDAAERIKRDFPSLKDYTYVIALDRKIIQGNHPLNDGQTIAFMPPFSGG